MGFRQKTNFSFHSQLPNYQQILGLISDLVLSEKESDFSGFLQKYLPILRDNLETQNILLFQKNDNAEFTLTHSLPRYSLENPLILDLREATLREIILHTDKPVLISPDNPLNIFLKSYLNLKIQSLMTIPLFWKRKLKGVCVVIWCGKNNLVSRQFEYFEIYRKLLELAYTRAGFFEENPEGHGKRKWQYSFEFLDHVINQLNIGIITIDKSFRIRYLNKNASELLQVETEGTLLRQVKEVLGAENTDKIFASLQNTGGTFERPEIEVLTDDGEKILIGFNITPFKDQEENQNGFILTLKDITYSSEMQEEMRRMDRLASLGVMASGIAHEIRNPLAGIKAIAQTFEEELESDDPKNEYVRRIIRQVNRMDDMLKTLFSYAKPQKPNRQFISVQQILQEVLVLLKQKFYQHNIILKQTFEPILPNVFVDGGQIQQVIFNLLLNSIEAIEKYGEIIVSVERVAKNMRLFQRKPFYQKITDNPYLLIHITDNGCGMPHETMYKIFNPFFTTKSFGTGLGLSIVYQIINENNGVIYFESQEEKGTDCYLFLPAYNTGKKIGVVER